MDGGGREKKGFPVEYVDFVFSVDFFRNLVFDSKNIIELLFLCPSLKHYTGRPKDRNELFSLFFS